MTNFETVTVLCPWCRPARVLLPGMIAGPIWLGKGERSDGICRPHLDEAMAAVRAARAA